MSHYSDDEVVLLSLSRLSQEKNISGSTAGITSATAKCFKCAHMYCAGGGPGKEKIGKHKWQNLQMILFNLWAK